MSDSATPLMIAATIDVSDLEAFEQQVVQLMKDWVANGPSDLGSMRRDRNGPGLDTESLEYEDHDAVAFMDVWWNDMIDAVLPQITEVAKRVEAGIDANAPADWEPALEELIVMMESIAQDNNVSKAA